MDILTYYNRQDDFQIDRAEKISNSMLGLLRVGFGKKVVVRTDYKGQLRISEEYASAKAKASAIVLSILFLPISLLAIAIGIAALAFSSTHGKNLLKEIKAENKEKALSPPTPASDNNESPPSPPSKPGSPLTPSSPNLPSPPTGSPKASPIVEKVEEKPRRPTIEVELNNQEFQRLEELRFIALLKERGNQIVNLSIKNTTISLIDLLPFIPNIERLYLEDCNLGEQGLKGFEGDLKLLHKLSIRKCNLTSEDAQALKNVQFARLHDLDLSENWLDDDAINPILSSLQKGSLVNLTLRDNQITSVGVGHLAQSDYLFKLELLDLCENPIDDEGIEKIAHARLPNLNYLDIATEHGTQKGIKALVDATLPNLKCVTVKEGSEALSAKYLVAIQK